MATGIPATTSIVNWQRATRHVEAAVRSGRYINAETCLVFAGPPRISDVGGLGNASTQSNSAGFSGGTSSDAILGKTGQDAFYPIGLLEQFNIQQAQNVQKMYEIGSRRSYQAGGRVQVVGSIGRVQFAGPSLLRALYAYYPGAVQMANGKTVGPGGNADSVSRGIVGAGDKSNAVFPDIFFEAGAKSGVDPESGDNLPHSFYINLMSELFSHPFGLGCLLRDNRNVNYAAYYLEDCMITTHSWGVSSTSTLITEGANLQADAAVPMEFSTSAGPQIRPLGG
jgi:hypothetical protein